MSADVRRGRRPHLLAALEPADGLPLAALLDDERHRCPCGGTAVLAASSASSRPTSVPGKVAAGIPDLTSGSASSTT